MGFAGRVCLVSLASLGPLVTLASLGAAPAAPPVRQLVTPVDLELQRGELILRFDFEVTKGRITGMPEVPTPWRVKITTSENSGKIEAVAETGTSEFKAEWFRDFVEVELDDGARLSLRVSTTEDGERVRRRLEFDNATLTLRPAAPKAAPPAAPPPAAGP